MKTLIFLLATLPLAVSQAQTVLQWKFVPEESHDYRLTQTARLDSGTGKTAKNIVDVVQQIEFTWKVIEVDAKGTAIIAMKVNSFSLTAKGPGGQEVAYDSTSSEDPLGYAAMLVPIGRRLSEEEVRLAMTPEGKVSMLDLPDDLAEAVKSIPGGKLFAKDGGAVSFESMARLGAPLVLPSDEISEVKTWTETSEFEVPPLGKASVEFTYAVKQVQEDKPVLIEQEMSITFEPDDQDSTPLLRKQVSSGIVQFDAAVGRPEQSSLKYQVELVPPSNPSNENSVIPLWLEQNIEFRSLSDVSQ